MQRTGIEALLPEVFRRTLGEGTPLQALLKVMAEQHAPSEALLASLPQLINPYSAPESHLTMLAHWLDLGCVFPPRAAGDTRSSWTPQRLPVPVGRLRMLIGAAAELARWRGTSYGLTTFLTLATGERGYHIEEDVTDRLGRCLPFHLCINAPVSAKPQRDLIERVIAAEKPAYVTCDLHFNSGPHSKH